MRGSRISNPPSLGRRRSRDFVTVRLSRQGRFETRPYNVSRVKTEHTRTEPLPSCSCSIIRPVLDTNIVDFTTGRARVSLGLAQRLQLGYAPVLPPSCPRTPQTAHRIKFCRLCRSKLLERACGHGFVRAGTVSSSIWLQVRSQSRRLPSPDAVYPSAYEA